LSHVVSGFLYTLIFPAVRLDPPVLGGSLVMRLKTREGPGMPTLLRLRLRHEIRHVDDGRHTGRLGINQGITGRPAQYALRAGAPNVVGRKTGRDRRNDPGRTSYSASFSMD
jgi:hypothetical protein